MLGGVRSVSLSTLPLPSPLLCHPPVSVALLPRRCSLLSSSFVRGYTLPVFIRLSPRDGTLLSSSLVLSLLHGVSFARALTPLPSVFSFAFLFSSRSRFQLSHYAAPLSTRSFSLPPCLFLSPLFQPFHRSLRTPSDYSFPPSFSLASTSIRIFRRLPTSLSLLVASPSPPTPLRQADLLLFFSTNAQR